MSAINQFLKPTEDWVNMSLDGKPQLTLDVLYKTLHNMGCRMDGIEYRIEKAVREKIKESKCNL